MTAQMQTETYRPARVRRMRTGNGQVAVMTSPLSSETAEREVQEFIRALERFKLRTEKLFPAWSEVLDILRSLGYKKTDA